MYTVHVTKTSKVGPDFKNLTRFSDIARIIPNIVTAEDFWPNPDSELYYFDIKAFLFWKAMTKTSYKENNPPEQKFIPINFIYCGKNDWLYNWKEAFCYLKP